MAFDLSSRCTFERDRAMESQLMVSAATHSEIGRKISELTFCIAELQRRQKSDLWRAWLWLWLLKENAARQMLAMLQHSVAKWSDVELTSGDRAELLSRHSLLIDPRETPSPIAPRWRTELQANVRHTLENFLNERQLGF